MGRKATNKYDLELARSRHQTVLVCIDHGCGVLRTAVRVLGWIGCFYITYCMVGELAGRETSFSGSLKAILDVSLNQWAYLVFASLMTGAYWNERRLKERTIKALQAHVRELETRTDPERTSSGLTPAGRTRKEDRGAL